jgi:hypothetical protein
MISSSTILAFSSLLILGPWSGPPSSTFHRLFEYPIIMPLMLKRAISNVQFKKLQDQLPFTHFPLLKDSLAECTQSHYLITTTDMGGGLLMTVALGRFSERSNGTEMTRNQQMNIMN